MSNDKAPDMSAAPTPETDKMFSAYEIDMDAETLRKEVERLERERDFFQNIAKSNLSDAEKAESELAAVRRQHTASNFKFPEFTYNPLKIIREPVCGLAKCDPTDEGADFYKKVEVKRYIDSALAEAIDALTQLERERDEARAKLEKAEREACGEFSEWVEVNGIRYAVHQEVAWRFFEQNKKLAAVREQLAAANKRAEEVEKDAARYRFIRSSTSQGAAPWIALRGAFGVSQWTGIPADDAIDKAMKNG